MFLCDVINWSIILVLNLSRTHGNFHELSTLMILALMVVWPLSSCLSELAQLVLSLLGDDVVGTDFLCNFSESSVLVHGALGDWDHGVDHIPKDAFNQWGSGKGTSVGKSSVKVYQIDEFLQVKRTVLGIMGMVYFHLFMHLLINKSLEELIMEKNPGVLSFSRIEVLIGFNLKNESKDTCKERGCLRVITSNLGWVYFGVDHVDDVHLKVHNFPVNRVFSWRMEMELLSEKIGFFNVLVKKIDGLSGQEIVLSVVISNLLSLLERKEEGLVGLVEFVRSMRIENFVVEFKFVVNKIFFDGNG